MVRGTIAMVPKNSLFKSIGEDFSLLIKLNIVFLIACVPVITIPAALTAMLKILTERVRGRETDLLPDFILYFRVSFFTSLRTGIFLAAAAVLFGYILWFYGTAASASRVILSALRGAAALQIVILYLLSCYLWVIEAVADLPFGTALKRAFQMMIVYVRQSLLSLLAGILIFAGGLLGFPWTLPFLLLLAFSLWGYVCAYYLFPVAERHIPLND